MKFVIRDGGGDNITLEWVGKRAARPASPQELEMFLMLKEKEQEILDLRLQASEMAASVDALEARLEKVSASYRELQGKFAESNANLMARVQDQQRVIKEKEEIIQRLKPDRHIIKDVEADKDQEAKP